MTNRNQDRSALLFNLIQTQLSPMSLAQEYLYDKYRLLIA